MINLLPLENKKNIHRRYYFRLGILTLSLTFTGLIIGIIVLLPSLFLVNTKEEVVKNRLDVISKSTSIGRSDENEKIIQDISNKVNILSKEDEVDPMSSVIMSVIDSKTINVRITGFFYQPVGDEKRVLVRGVASDRDGLTEFTNKIQKSSVFKEVNLPVSHLAKSEDIIFSISLILPTK